MKVTYQKPRDFKVAKEETIEPTTELETVTIDLADKFIEYLKELEEDNYRVQKIVMHPQMYSGMTQSMRFAETREMCPDGTATFYGVKIETEDLGRHSIADFLIYTDKKVFHSDMIDKDFVEDLDIEEMLHKTNQKIDER